MAEKMDFEKANKRLNEIVSNMEKRNYTLDETLVVYEEAYKLLAYCYDQLESYKGQVMDINTRIKNLKKEDLFND